MRLQQTVETWGQTGEGGTDFTGGNIVLFPARFARLLAFIFHRIHVLVGNMQYFIGASCFAGLGCMAYR